MSRALDREFRSLAAVLLLAPCAAMSPQALSPAQAQKPQRLVAPAIQVEEVETADVRLPADFRMALYENLVDQVQKTKKFQHVYRSGERSADNVPDLVVLRTRLEGFKEGSERMRQVTTVAGATSIKVHVEIAARDGRVLLGRDVQGKVHFFGNNLRATYNLSKQVAKILRLTF